MSRPRTSGARTVGFGGGGAAWAGAGGGFAGASTGAGAAASTGAAGASCTGGASVAGIGGSWWNRTRPVGCWIATFCTGRGAAFAAATAGACEGAVRDGGREAVGAAGPAGGAAGAAVGAAAGAAAGSGRRSRRRRRGVGYRRRSCLGLAGRRRLGPGHVVLTCNRRRGRLARPIDARQDRGRHHCSDAGRHQHDERRPNDRAVPLRSRRRLGHDAAPAQRGGRHCLPQRALRRGAWRHHDAQRRRKPCKRSARRRGDWRDIHIAREQPSGGERRRHVGLRKALRRHPHQRRVRPRQRAVAIVRIAKRENQVLGSRCAIRGPPDCGVVEPVLRRHVTPQHRAEAIHIAAPIELARGLQVASPAGLERLQEPGRLIVVLGLPSYRQSR